MISRPWGQPFSRPRSKPWAAAALVLVLAFAVFPPTNVLQRISASHDGSGSECTGSSSSTIRYWDLVVADMDGNGHSDLVLGVDGAGATAVRILYDPGDSTPVQCWRKFELEAHQLSKPRLAVGDIDQDGHLDVVAASFDRRNVQYWLLAPNAVKDSGQAQVPDPDADGGGDSDPNHALLLSSLALADVDADRDLDLAVTSMRVDDKAAVTSLYAYDEDRRFTTIREWRTRSAVRTRFVDSDADGNLEIVNSVYSLRHPVTAPETSENGLVWAEVLSPTGPNEAIAQLTAHFDAPLISEPPRASVVDFDVLGVGDAQRFALAISAHHCANLGCWNDDAQGGFVQVVDNDGRVHWSSAAGELQMEKQASAELGSLLRYVPSKLRFTGSAPSPGLVIGYWQVLPHKNSCTQRKPCAGPVLVAANLSQEPTRATDADFLAQGIGLRGAASAQPRKHCESPTTSLVHLPDHNIAAIVGVEANGRSLRFTWVPDTDFVRLNDPFEGATVCVQYFAANGKEAAIADEVAGARLVSLNKP